MGLLDSLLAASQGGGLLGGLPASWPWQPGPGGSTQDLLPALQNAPDAANGGALAPPVNGAVAAPPQPAPPQPAPAAAALPAALGGNPPAGFLDQLNSGLQSLAHGGSLLGALTGNLTDRSTLAQQNLNAQFEAARDVLRQSGLSDQQATSRAMLAVMNPEAGKAIFAAALANDGKPAGAADATGASPRGQSLAPGVKADAPATDHASKPKAGLPATPPASGAAASVLQADPGARASETVQPAVVAADPSTADRTAPGLQAPAAGKTAKPTLRQSRQPQLPQGPQAATSLFGLMPPARMAPSAPIFAVARKPIDLSLPGAAAANPAPIFPRR